jgi:hypothetical protein
MKTASRFCIFLMTICSVYQAAGQDEKVEAAKITLKDFKLGFAIGPSINLVKTVDPYLADTGNVVQFQKLSLVAMKVSTSLVFNRKFIYKKTVDTLTTTDEPLRVNGSRNKAVASSKLPKDTEYLYPGRFSLIVTLNIAELSNGSVGVNKTIEGGIGGGVRVSPAFHIVGLVELANIRALRDQYNVVGKPITIPGSSPAKNLNALDRADEKYFFSKIVPSLSIRFIYVFGDDDPTL